MKFRVLPVILLAFILISVTGCAKKADPARPVDKIRKEVVTMPLKELEVQASDYAAAIRAQKTEIEKIQKRIQTMPVDKLFSDKSLTRQIAEIGREAEALFERYRIYAQAFQQKGGDLAKIQVEPIQS